MNEDKLIENILVDCPFCNRVHSIDKRQRKTQAIIKGEVVDYSEFYFLVIRVKKIMNLFQAYFLNRIYYPQRMHIEKIKIY